MNTRHVLITLGAVAVAAALLKLAYDRIWMSDISPSKNGSSPNVKQMIEDTLQEHHGENAPFVHAFEEALDEEMRYEQVLAAASGLRA